MKPQKLENETEIVQKARNIRKIEIKGGVWDAKGSDTNFQFISNSLFVVRTKPTYKRHSHSYNPK